MAYADHEHMLVGYGTALWVSIDNITYTAIDDLRSVEGPDHEREESDDTSLQSPNRMHLSDPGWWKGGEVPFTVFLHKTQFSTLSGYFYAGTTLYWRVTFPLLSTEATPTKWEWTGWLKKCKLWNKAEGGNNDKGMCDLSIFIKTKPALTMGSA